MALAAEQNIFNWQLDGSQYSGGGKEQEAVRSYSSDISQAYQNLRSKQGDEQETERLGSGNSQDTETMQWENFLADISNYPVRKQALPEIRRLRSSSLSPSQEWEGYVTQICENSFTAKLSNIRDQFGLPAEEAEFDLKELPYADQQRLELGSIIRWIVGFERFANDQRQRVSRLHLRRLPVFTKLDIERAQDEAAALLDGIIWDDAS